MGGAAGRGFWRRRPRADEPRSREPRPDRAGLSDLGSRVERILRLAERQAEDHRTATEAQARATVDRARAEASAILSEARAATPRAPTSLQLIIVAGQLHLDPADRDRYLTGVAEVASRARQAPGCHDFVQTADPIDPGRINIFERWASDEDLHRFRDSGRPLPDLPDLRSVEVHKYRIAGIEAP
ncbi:antibiotic biosynthesis monooxygenase family protein [Rugosimonospora africana]|uniref:ABM domain-containing protein n=1 Tax=Rugosimonospora africana TaxID=556532 RepID=A0A8J3VPE3_9ACTN|nr:antibiotic biosynthesis monooxygenase family protein [Rugosimonospora africana]GIH14005.1 hypothetical protein Raf01_21770 [Rugosimonospora africana]